MPPPSNSSIETNGEILPQIARAQIAAELKVKFEEPEAEPEGYLAKKQGVFVTLRSVDDGELRGCIGSVEPKFENLIEETRANAVSAAVSDKRFSPLKKKDFDGISIEVSVLSEPERVGSIADLDPEIYGVVLTSRDSGNRGVMLPNVPDLNTVDKQLAAIRRKAGLRPDESLRIERFRVEKFAE